MTTSREPASAWGVPARREPLWPARLTILATLLLYVALPERLTLGVGPKWGVPILELALLLVLFVAAPRHRRQRPPWTRLAAILLTGVVSAANVLSLALLVDALLHGNKATGRELLFSSVEIWLTNVLVFALWYWELDRGGPDARRDPAHREPDFLFPQMTTPGCADAGWAPGFVDYLYVSFTNATAFSPTDTMPLTPWAKGLMTVQSLASLLTVALVAARAVNILS